MSRENRSVGTIRVRDRDYDVELEVTAYGREAKAKGFFVIPKLTTGRHQSAVRAETWEALYEAAIKATKAKKVKIAIPVMRPSVRTKGDFTFKREDRVYEHYFESGTIIGRHSGNGNLFVRWGDSTEAKQENDYHAEYFRPLNEERQKEYTDLLDQESRLMKAKQDFEDRYKIEDIAADVEAEIERVASEME